MTPSTGLPAGRYASPAPRRRPGVVAAVVVLATVFVGWVVWAALGATAPDASGQVTGFRVRGPHSIQVRLAMGGQPGPITCTVQAQGRSHEVVGVTDARATVADDGRVQATVRVRTRDRAVTAVVGSCTRG